MTTFTLKAGREIRVELSSFQLGAMRDTQLYKRQEEPLMELFLASPAVGLLGKYYTVNHMYDTIVGDNVCRNDFRIIDGNSITIFDCQILALNRFY